MNDFLKEKELLLNSIENNTSEHWKNYYKNVPIECIYDDLVIDINEIKRLQQEIKELKEENKKIKETIQEYNDAGEYIYKLEDNWNKLKEWLVQLQKFKGINQQGFSWGVAQEVLDKMQEIEGGMNE